MTNKLLLAITGLLLLANVSRSQSFHFGLKADVSFSTISGKGLAGTFRPAFNAGVFSEYDFSKKWGVQPEVLFTLYNNKSGDDFLKYYSNSGNNNGKNSIQLGYLSIPVLLSYHVNDVISINVGPQYSMLLYANEDLLKNNKEAFKSSDLGVVAGLTLQVSQVRFYGRYVIGLSDVNNIDDRYNWRTHQIQFGLGVLLK
jgi:hypothetical protein